VDDLSLLHEWLQRPHVKRWWNDGDSYEQVAAHYLPSIEGRDPTDLYVILLGEQPAGFIQTYLVADYPDYAALVGVGEGVAGVDLFLADPELLGTGSARRPSGPSWTAWSSRRRPRPPASPIRPWTTPPRSGRSRRPAFGQPGTSSTPRTEQCTGWSAGSGPPRAPEYSWLP
jgi:GNAT acetyltransferase-like protein